MKRDLMTYLLKWKDDPKKKPILLRGARQVGKSWLARELGNHFENFVEINFEKHTDLNVFFEGNLDPKRIIHNIGNYFQQKIEPGKTLLFLDEIQSCPRAILSLRYFYEDMPQLHVISAGSLLEFELRKISSPVGRIHFVHVYPLSFAEYLVASGRANLREMLLESLKSPLPEPFHRLLSEEIRNYTILGGMPEVVKEYLDSGDFTRCLDFQTDLLETYRNDFHKYAREHQVKYIQKVFDSLTLQLGNKFKYSNVSREIKSRELSEALELLEMAGVVYRVFHTSANGIPLRAEANMRKFKVLFFDIGLAQRLLRLDYRSLLLDPDISRVNDGAVAELLVGLELIAYRNFRERPELYYWHRESRSSNAEVDYITALGSRIVPVEVKSGLRGAMKSLNYFMDSKNSQFALKVSGAGYSRNGNIENIPFYALESLFNHQPG